MNQVNQRVTTGIEHFFGAYFRVLDQLNKLALRALPVSHTSVARTSMFRRLLLDPAMKIWQSWHMIWDTW